MAAGLDSWLVGLFFFFLAAPNPQCVHVSGKLRQAALWQVHKRAGAQNTAQINVHDEEKRKEFMNGRRPLQDAPPSQRRAVPHMDSNSSIRCLVLPCRICRSVLYLSRPALTFSACSTSFCVFLLSSLAWANSELSVCGSRLVKRTYLKGCYVLKSTCDWLIGGKWVYW